MEFLKNVKKIAYKNKIRSNNYSLKLKSKMIFRIFRFWKYDLPKILKRNFETNKLEKKFFKKKIFCIWKKKLAFNIHLKELERNSQIFYNKNLKIKIFKRLNLIFSFYLFIFKLKFKKYKIMVKTFNF